MGGRLIDVERNNVIIAFNAVLEQCGELPLPLIPLSSGPAMEASCPGDRPEAAGHDWRVRPIAAQLLSQKFP